MTWVDATKTCRHRLATTKEIEQVLEYRRRRAKARFYADENFPRLAVEILRQRGAKVVTVQEVGSKREPDENHTAYSLKHGYILISCDRDYLDENRFPLIHCPAIIVFDFGFGSQAEIEQSFRCLGNALRAPQFFDKWMKIEASRSTWTEYFRTLDGQTHRLRYRIHRGVLQEWVE
jgi:predicted nuclease of predicted toxin-antitoxin system